MKTLLKFTNHCFLTFLAKNRLFLTSKNCSIFFGFFRLPQKTLLKRFLGIILIDSMLIIKYLY